MVNAHRLVNAMESPGEGPELESPQLEIFTTFQYGTLGNELR